MNIFSQVRSYWRVLPSARRNRLDLLVWLRHRPQILAATAVYETALVASARMDMRLKQLAELKTAALVNCEYCLDIGSALCLATGISETQLRDLPNFRTSDAFSGDEKMVLEFAGDDPTACPDPRRSAPTDADSLLTNPSHGTRCDCRLGELPRSAQSGLGGQTERVL